MKQTRPRDEYVWYDCNVGCELAYMLAASQSGFNFTPAADFLGKSAISIGTSLTRPRLSAIPQKGYESDLIPGDIRVWTATKPDPDNPIAFANEHTIYLGDGRYYAPFLGKKDDYSAVDLRLMNYRVDASLSKRPGSAFQK
jgi:hypothetical protein